MADRILLGKNTNTGNVGFWVSKPGANVVLLAGNSYMESLGNWYGYQKEFDDSPETAWTFEAGTEGGGITTAATYSYDPGVEGISTFTNWRTYTTACTTPRVISQLKRSADNTMLISPTGYDSRIYTETMYNNPTIANRGLAPDSRAFSPAEHNIIEIRIRRNMDHPEPPPASTGDFFLMFMSSPSGGSPKTGSSTTLATFANNVSSSTPASDAIHPYFWARKNSTGTYNQTPTLPVASGLQFEYPTSVHTDQYNIGGVVIPDGGTTSPSGTSYGVGRVSLVDSVAPADWKYTTMLPDGDWHILEMDMSNDKKWSNPFEYMEEWRDAAKVYNADTSPTGIRQDNQEAPYNEPHLNDGRTPYSSEYKIVRMRFDLINSTWSPTHADPANPPWLFEIDYVRVKKKGVPNDSGKYGNVKDSMLFSSDWQNTGLVHQEGTVTIGTQKANIDGTTSPFSFDKVNHTSTLSDGIISFPKLPYIPVVLFQRYDKGSAGATANSYPGGEQEFSIATTKWEDQTYPIESTKQAQFYNGYDIALRNDVGDVGDASWGPLKALGTLAAFTNISDYTEYDNYADFDSGLFPNAPDALPWNDTPIPAPSARAGNTFSDYAYYFSEMRTFAYARAGKDHFSLTCRNAIAQEGVESLWNLSPTLPEAATANQGLTAFNTSEMKDSSGNWGMFHPALITFNNQDGNNWQPFSEGLTLKPSDTLTTANSILIDLQGSQDGTDYPQYKWWLNYSGYPFVYDGSLAKPSDFVPTDKAEFRDRYANGAYYGETGGFYPSRYQKIKAGEKGVGDLTQYSVKRLSSPGIFHPTGVVPDSSPAVNNRNAVDSLSAGSPISNHTSYIGGSWNEVGGGGATSTFNAAAAKPPAYKYWVLRIPASIQGYTPNESQGG